MRALEIKSGSTWSVDFITGLKLWMRYSNANSSDCMVVYAGETRFSHLGIDIVPWSEAASAVALTDT
jgi:hypothetical protein